MEGRSTDIWRPPSCESGPNGLDDFRWKDRLRRQAEPVPGVGAIGSNDESGPWDRCVLDCERQRIPAVGLAVGRLVADAPTVGDAVHDDAPGPLLDERHYLLQLLRLPTVPPRQSQLVGVRVNVHSVVRIDDETSGGRSDVQPTAIRPPDSARPI